MTHDHHADPDEQIGRDLTTSTALRFLARYFRTRTLMPFAIYSLVAGVAMIVYTTI